MEKSFKILTFNAGLLSILGKDIVPYVDERIKYICVELEKVEVDVIFLQEIFNKKHYETIRDALKNFPYHKKSKAKNIFLAPGLCIFSKFPIVHSQFERFSEHQDIEKFSNHGFESSKILINEVEIDLVNVHLTAGGFTGNLETKKSTKVALKQAKQLLQNINNEKTILLGDFNCGLRTDTDVYEEFISNNYQDPLVQFALEENITWDNQNTLVAKQNFDMPTDRIDQILLPKNSEFKYVSHEIKLKQTYPNIPYNLSDHYAILMEIAYKNIT